MTSLTSHQFNNQVISQLMEDTLINGKLIPKGYCNATEICKVNGKQWKRYKELNQTNEYLLELGESIKSTDSIITIDSGLNEYRGTWVHHLVALHLAQWISPKFSVWANTTLWHVINGDFQALTAEAKESQVQLQKTWQSIRDAGKLTRRTLTDAVKDWYERNPKGSSRPMPVMIANVTNDIYKALWGMDALSLESLLECGRHKSRDYMDAASLKTLDRAEANVMDYIDDDNIKPSEAVKLANIRIAKTLPTRADS